MERGMASWLFEDPPKSPAVTTHHVTAHKLPILEVSHDLDDEGVSTWQFHCGTVPFSMEDAQLVSLDAVVAIDPTVLEIADLPVGYVAKRQRLGGRWRRFKNVEQ
jgi:hypothetical protein